MSVHVPPSAPSRSPAVDAAHTLLRSHLDARSYVPCVASAPALAVPRGFECDDDLRAAAALAIAETFGLLDAGRAAAAVEFIRAGLAGAADEALDHAEPEATLAWCTAAAEWCERNGLDHEFSRLQPRAAVADSSVAASPWARVHWRIAAAWHHEWFGRRGDVAALLDEAVVLARAAGDLGLQVNVQMKQARLALARSDPVAAVALAQCAAVHADETTSPLWLADAADVEARAAMVRGDTHRALQQARRARGLAELARATPSYTFTYRLYEAYALLAMGAWDEAVALARELAAIELPSGMRKRTAVLADLFGLVRDERTEGGWAAAQVERLRTVLARLRELDWPGALPVLPVHMARLWARALEAGVETDWVRASIVSRDLPPPEPAWPEGWPWSVRISVLGGFRCSVDGADLAANGGKASGKPLALLRRVAVEGGYEGVGADLLAAALWPGEGRDGRDKALEITLARLRRLLGRADAVLLHERRLRLNPQRVWLDRVALERLLDGLAAPTVGHWPAVWTLWRGPLLAGEPSTSELDAARNGLRARMAAALHAASAHPGHRARCLRALAVDPELADWL